MLRDSFKDTKPLYGQDPYLYTLETGARLLIQSEDEQRIVISDYDRPGTRKVVWEPKDEHQIWAPELHLINGVWLILYTSSDGNNHNHRNKALYSILPLGPYFPCRATGPDIWGIDQTIFLYNWKYYCIWSGWENNGDEFPQHLYIAPYLSEERIKISSPTEPWESDIVEGPQYHNGILYYSANASWEQSYSTGRLFLTGHPLDPDAWRKDPEPLFTNFGHAQPLGDNTFIGHTKLSPMPGWTDRVITTRRV